MKSSLSTDQAVTESRRFVIVTRPRAQLEGLINRLTQRVTEERLDCKILGLPLLEIEPLGDRSLAQNLSEGISSSDLVIFVSPNAVISAKALLDAHQYAWPQGCSVAVVGGGTEQSIKEQGLIPKELIKPAITSSWDSEGLWKVLNTPEKSWAGKRIVFVKGQGGRHWLMEQFTQRGAEVVTFEVYKRTPLLVTDSAWATVATCCQSDQGQSIWVLTSSEAVLQIPNSLKKLGIPVDYLKQSKAICSHERIKQVALEVGFGDVKLCEAGDLNLVEATMILLKSPSA